MNKYPVSIAFLAGILLFFLPFVEVKCNATPLYEARGFDLVKGFTVKEGKTAGDFSISDNMNEKQQGNAFAIAAFVLGIVGLILSFLNFKTQPLVSAATGALAALSLVAMFIQVKSDVGKWNTSAKPNSDNVLFNDMSRNIKVTAEFTPWFYLALISFGVAAYLSYKKWRSVPDEQPPKHAPQLSVQNPGEQSDFPSAASESQIG